MLLTSLDLQKHPSSEKCFPPAPPRPAPATLPPPPNRAGAHLSRSRSPPSWDCHLQDSLGENKSPITSATVTRPDAGLSTPARDWSLPATSLNSSSEVRRKGGLGPGCQLSSSVPSCEDPSSGETAERKHKQDGRVAAGKAKATGSQDRGGKGGGALT